MTKFDENQIGDRKGRQASTYTTQELRRMMTVYQQTGYHPVLEQQEAAAREERGLEVDEDWHRPLVFLDVAVEGEAKGTILIEVFEDLAPSASREFMLRASGAGAGRAGDVSYEGTQFHKVVDGLRLEGGRRTGDNDKPRGQGVQAADACC